MHLWNLLEIFLMHTLSEYWEFSFAGSQDLRAPEERMLHSIHPSIVETLPETFPDLKHEFSKLVSAPTKWMWLRLEWPLLRTHSFKMSRDWYLIAAIFEIGKEVVSFSLRLVFLMNFKSEKTNPRKIDTTSHTIAKCNLLLISIFVCGCCVS